ncbi:MAG: hypothetical protein ACOYXB_05315 [Bacteroidota bacterium]
MESIEVIRKLLAKFYSGESNLEEEEQLAAFFREGLVPDDLAAEREMFRLFSGAESRIEIPSDLDNRLEEVIDRAERNEARTRKISLMSLSGLAAGLMIILAVYLAYIREDRNTVITAANYSDTYDDPVKAYEETMKALNYISSRFNDGTKELKPLGQVSQGVQHIQPLSLINRGQKELQIIGKFDKNKSTKQQ